MQAHNMPFATLINGDRGANHHFHVPKYQREYTWKRIQWDQLLGDINENDSGYFMGSIICVKDVQLVAPGGETIFDVVDGQQRLTTLSLLLSAIHSKLDAAMRSNELEDEQVKEDLKSDLANIRAKLVKRKIDAKRGEPGSFTFGKNVYFLRVQPSAQNNNLADYLYLLHEAKLINEAPPKQAYSGNRLLGRAYAFFRDETPAEVPALLALVEKINQLMFVTITVDNHSDAFTLFESLNNRGVKLSPMDIIKNKILAKMELEHKVDIEESFVRWTRIVEAIPDATEQERFLRHFYNAFKHLDKIKVKPIPRATKSVIIRIYEDLIKRDAPLLFDELEETAATYGKLLRADFAEKRIATGLTELHRIGSAPAYLVLLYLFSLQPIQFVEVDFLERVVDLMRRYFIRRNVTDKPPTRQIDQGLIDVVESCGKRLLVKGKKLAFDRFAEDLMSHAPPASLAEFKAALEGDIYDNNTAMARYLLVQIDQLHHSRESAYDLWARDDKGRFVWTVEHVLPQAEKLPEHWVKMIAGGDRSQATDLQTRWVHRLGNLTLSGYNSDLATAPFEKKQKLARDRSFLGYKINIGYKNGLHLNSLAFNSKAGKFSLADAPCWNADLIEARTKLLVEMIAKANLLPGEKFG